MRMNGYFKCGNRRHGDEWLLVCLMKRAIFAVLSISASITTVERILLVMRIYTGEVFHIVHMQAVLRGKAEESC